MIENKERLAKNRKKNAVSRSRESLLTRNERLSQMRNYIPSRLSQEPQSERISRLNRIHERLVCESTEEREHRLGQTSSRKRRNVKNPGKVGDDARGISREKNNDEPHSRDSASEDMAATASAVVGASILLSLTARAAPSAEHSCAPFFFPKVKRAGDERASIVRLQCDESPPFDGRCDPTFTERVYHSAVSGYSCLVEYVARPTPILEEPARSDRESYDDYFKQLGMTATPAGWVLQDTKSGVLLQIRPNIPYELALEPCWDHFKNQNYKYIGGMGGHAWEGTNATHQIRYSPIAQDFKYSSCVLSADTRRYQMEQPPPPEGRPPGDNVRGGCPAGQVSTGGGSCGSRQSVGKR
ncbi:hypothetical protein EVAR_25957_1 [Eumeta japonica]|uniref:Uncharacterized protein n=1 Tax=Eumeta variegata TaxID=151549 RepID=A0A4C1V1C8_EUMVA|nr:hypothetical protein EVAR_25957_1 [Eumeta japonica]